MNYYLKNSELVMGLLTTYAIIIFLPKYERMNWSK